MHFHTLIPSLITDRLSSTLNYMSVNCKCRKTFDPIKSTYIYRVSQKVVAKLNMLVCHIMMNQIYIGTYVQKCKL